MNILDVLSKKVSDDSIEHAVNPVYDTAKDCLINLCKAQCHEAITLNEKLHFVEETKPNSAITKGTALFQESRYRFVNNEILKSGIKNILDIGCGYSPRGILFAEQGYNYVGADLPAAINEIEPAILSCLNETGLKHIAYSHVDATNPQSLICAAANLEGPLCIITEGMFMYFPIYELTEYVKGLKLLLEAHGGCIITPDFCMNSLFKAALRASSGNVSANVLQKLAGSIVKGYTVPSNSESDPVVWYTKEDDSEPYQYFTQQGFTIERVPLYDSEIHLATLSSLKETKRESFIKDCKDIYGWKMQYVRA